MWVAQVEGKKPYYPGFQDLNLYAVAVFLIVFLYLILIGSIAYRVISTKNKLREVVQLLESAPTTDDPAVIQALDEAIVDRDRLTVELDRLTAQAPGKWFRGR
jgi:hypothetical protein